MNEKSLLEQTIELLERFYGHLTVWGMDTLPFEPGMAVRLSAEISELGLRLYSVQELAIEEMTDE